MGTGYQLIDSQTIYDALIKSNMIWWSWFRLVKYGHHLLHMSHMVRFAIREYYYFSGEQENVWYWIKYFFPQFLKKTSGFIKLYHLGRIIPVIFCIDDAKNQLLNYSFIRRQCGTFTKMLFSEKCVTRPVIDIPVGSKACCEKQWNLDLFLPTLPPYICTKSACFNMHIHIFSHSCKLNLEHTVRENLNGIDSI